MLLVKKETSGKDREGWPCNVVSNLHNGNNLANLPAVGPSPTTFQP